MQPLFRLLIRSLNHYAVIPSHTIKNTQKFSSKFPHILLKYMCFKTSFYPKSSIWGKVEMQLLCRLYKSGEPWTGPELAQVSVPDTGTKNKFIGLFVLKSFVPLWTALQTSSSSVINTKYFWNFLEIVSVPVTKCK